MRGLEEARAERGDWLETSKKQKMTQGEFLLPFAPACLPRHWTQEPRTSLGDYSPSVADSGERWGTWGTKLPPQGKHRLLNFPSYAFPHRLPRFLMRLRLGSRADGGKSEMADRGMAGSRAKGAPTWMVLRTGRAEPIVNHRFSGIRDRSKRTGTGEKSSCGFYLAFSLPPRALAGRGCAPPRACVPLALGPREGRA